MVSQQVRRACADSRHPTGMTIRSPKRRLTAAPGILPVRGCGGQRPWVGGIFSRGRWAHRRTTVRTSPGRNALRGESAVLPWLADNWPGFRLLRAGVSDVRNPRRQHAPGFRFELTRSRSVRPPPDTQPAGPRIQYTSLPKTHSGAYHIAAYRLFPTTKTLLPTLALFNSTVGVAGPIRLTRRLAAGKSHRWKS
jgi:hypothetical protein